MTGILFINGSPRKDGCCSKMISKAVEKFDNFESEVISIYDLNFKGCVACNTCKKTGKCVQNDDMIDIIDKIRKTETMVIASPIYFGGETGPVKTFIDRLYSMIKTVNGERVVDIGNLKNISLLFVCGSPDGAMTYASILAKYTAIFRNFGITSVDGCIVPEADPNTVLNSEFADGYYETLAYLLGV